MTTDQKNNSLSGMILFLFIATNAVILEHALTVNDQWYWALIFTLPLFSIAAFYHKRMGNPASKNL